MTNEEFDARITRLTERHEALAESVEGLAHAAEAGTKRLEAIEKEQRRMRAAVRAALQAWAEYDESEL